MDQCTRTILLTHSQGNFYGNAIFNDFYANYAFPNGYSLAAYPMLGMMQIATPVYTPGGAAGEIYPDTVGNLTNSNDIVMGVVRAALGAQEANYEADYNSADPSGHGLVASYLQQSGQAANIAQQMYNIAHKLIPYPMHHQFMANSSALNGIGYSGISQLLDVEFDAGGVYRYHNVPESVSSQLLNAQSQGTYFNSSIRNTYWATKLE